MLTKRVIPCLDVARGHVVRAEVIIAPKNGSREELTYEMADLLFHAVVLLADAGMTPSEIEAELARRHRA